MTNLKKCKWCNEEFIPDHGNDTYCSDHDYDAKRERQKQERDPIKHLLILLKDNHKALHSMFCDGILEANAVLLEAYRVDISLCRYLQSSTEHKGMLTLDFGQYFLTTDNTFSLFKLHKHNV